MIQSNARSAVFVDEGESGAGHVLGESGFEAFRDALHQGGLSRAEVAVPPLEFNRLEDSIFHGYNLDNQKYMEYLESLGSYPDIPVALIIQGWKKSHGEDRVNGWIAELEARAGERGQDFYTEDPISE